MTTWLEDIITALENLGGQAHLSDIYNEVARIRIRSGKPLPKLWQGTMRRKILNHAPASAGYTGTAIFEPVGQLGSGIWKFHDRFHDPSRNLVAVDINEPPERMETVVNRIIRDTALAQKMKALHENVCQLCHSPALLLPGRKPYSETHHIVPLGQPHNGEDVEGNILVLCPNHHVMLDYGAIQLDLDDLLVHQDHVIDHRFVHYYNSVIWKRL
ncbi:MAG: HNH endonuclease [Chloroflexi bacterium]|nr:HNH endonuclease [Chloroflexota bacterium]